MALRWLKIQIEGLARTVQEQFSTLESRKRFIHSTANYKTSTTIPFAQSFCLALEFLIRLKERELCVCFHRTTCWIPWAASFWTESVCTLALPVFQSLKAEGTKQHSRLKLFNGDKLKLDFIPRAAVSMFVSVESDLSLQSLSTSS